MKAVLTPRLPSHSRTARAANSGPLSERMCDGVPRASISSARTSSTSDELSLRFTRIASASRVNSSTTQSMRNLRPSCVRSSTKS